MLVNIHFQMDQKWPSQIRDHYLCLGGRGSDWQKGGEIIQKFRNEENRNIGI